MISATQRIGIPLGIIGGGIALVVWGMRPKSSKEKIAEQVSQWQPPKESFSEAQFSRINQIAQEMNAVRGKVRSVWQNQSISANPSQFQRMLDYSTAWERDVCPWRAQKIGAANMAVGKGKNAYTTDMIAPQLQNAWALLDLALYQAGITNLKEETTSAEALSILRGLDASRIQKIADIASKKLGTYLPALAAHSYDVISAQEIAAMTESNMPSALGEGVQRALAWIALNTPLSDLSPEERKTQKELRNEQVRKLRLIIP